MSDYELFMNWLELTYPTHKRVYSGDPVIQSAFFAGLSRRPKGSGMEEAFTDTGMNRRDGWQRADELEREVKQLREALRHCFEAGRGIGEERV